MDRAIRIPFAALLGALLSAILLGIVGELSFWSSSTAATSSAIAPASTWLRGWPMDGHDPQRTGLSLVSGPIHPHLVREHAGFSGELVAPDGSIIGTAGTWPHVALAALSPSGRLVKLSTRVTGASAIRRDGAILSVGADSGAAEAVASTGIPLWQRSSIGLPKSSRPLVTPDGRFFIAAEGHPQDGTSGLWVLSTEGRVAHHAARGVPTFGVTVGLDGSVYTLLYDQATGVSYVAAYSPTLQEKWRYELNTSLEGFGGCDCLMTARDGGVYVGDGNILLALDAQGSLAWRFSKADGLLSIAERPDGSLLAAGSQTLTAISSRGQSLWDADIHIHHRIGVNDFVRAPAIAVDRAGTACVGTADGQVVVVAASGQLTAHVPAGGYRYGQTPRVMMSPHHMLAVTGTDSVVRIYR